MNRKVLIPLFLLVLLSGFAYSGLTGLFTGDADFSCEGCNVLFITLDTFRPDHTKTYGYPVKTTPVLDNIADSGVVFENAYVQIPFTPPSHLSIMTGLYPFHHGSFLPTDETDFETIALRLSRNGYNTAGFAASYMVGELGAGFSVFDKPDYKNTSGYRPAKNMTDLAISWLRDKGNDPFFLWVHYFDPHTPYNPPEKFDNFNYAQGPMYSEERYLLAGVDNFNSIRSDLGRYDGELAYLDHEIGRLLMELDFQGLSDNTMIVIISDHGECFGEHMFSEFGYDMSGPCLFHDKTLYQEEVRSFFVIKNPKNSLAGKRVEQIVESIDIFPTILDVLSLSRANGIDGKSLKPLIEGNRTSWDRAYFQLKPTRTGLYGYGMITPDWKYIKTGITLDKNGRPVDSSLLFDIKSDPKETKNLAQREEDISMNLEDELFSFIGKAQNKIYIDTRTEEILRMFGYIK